MHDAAYQWVAKALGTLPIPDLVRARVLEVGSYDVNGSVRPLFPPSTSYTGLDVREGPGVDIVADAAHWRSDETWDIVICTEVLEHAALWRDIVDTCVNQVRKGGMVIITCATHGRAPHGSDGSPAPRPGEHYKNIGADELAEALGGCVGEVTIDILGTDLRAVAYK